MTSETVFDWSGANQRYLTDCLAQLRRLLERALERDGRAEEEATPSMDPVPPMGMQPPPALEILANLFSLSPFERGLLLLCAGVELDSHFASLIASLRGDPQKTSPTFSLGLSILPGAHWNALAPSAPLRRWRLIEPGSGSVITQSPLRIDERILHYLTGITHLDERLTGYAAPLANLDPNLVPSQAAIAGRIVSSWEGGDGRSHPPVIQLVGGDAGARQAIAAAACARMNMTPYVMQAAALPASPVEMESLRLLWEREALLSGCLLFLDCERNAETDAGRELLLGRWIDALRTPLILSGRERLPAARSTLAFDVAKPTMAEQRDLWREALGPAAAGLNGRMEALVSNFDLDAAAIRDISLKALQQADGGAGGLADGLWQACRDHSRPRLSELAQYIQPLATWHDLVLPEVQMQTLREISIHVRQRVKVYQTWGFAAHSARGLGISALFSGVSGTGKTMAAEVLANDLQLELYRIDLSQVVSKYIGETEKNLRRVFDAAEEGGSILLFDEADALFGKRSEVRDSHDRYANVEVSYLLQRMETYRGLAILTTNLKENLDPAFLRRIRFLVHFPFPDVAQRAEIWRRIFPAETPTEGLDVKRLARLNIPGGNIRNIAVYAAFLAADAGEPVRMSHLQRAAQVEFVKLERPLAETELGGPG